MASASFIAENTKRRNAINRVRKETGLAPPRQPAAAPQQTAGPKPKIIEQAEQQAPNRQQQLDVINQSLQGIAGSQQQRLLASASRRPNPSSKMGMKREVERFTNLMRPVWK